MNPTREQREDQGVSLTLAWFRPSHQGSSCRAAANCDVRTPSVSLRKVAGLTFMSLRLQLSRPCSAAARRRSALTPGVAQRPPRGAATNPPPPSLGQIFRWDPSTCQGYRLSGKAALFT